MKPLPINTIKQEIKSNLHVRNKHKNRYDFTALIASFPELKSCVHINQFGIETIDFADPKAVKFLNQALLKHFYNINWDIPNGYLCPPIPGRADYLHHLAEFIASDLKQVKNYPINCLDIGTGANLIYPILGVIEYNWQFVGTDIDKNALLSAAQIIESNPQLKDSIILLHQKNKRYIFKDIIHKNEHFFFSLCNPPFHASEKEANMARNRKLDNLNIKKNTLNFGGNSNELWTDGGELKFIQIMIKESKEYEKNCLWFTSLVSKQKNLVEIKKTLYALNAIEIRHIEMSQGQKKSRIIAWTYMDKLERQNWIKKYY